MVPFREEQRRALIGGGNLARFVLGICQDNNIAIAGFFSDDFETSPFRSYLPGLGPLSAVWSAENENICFTLALGSQAIRKNFLADEPAISLGNPILHPTVAVSSNSVLGAGVVVGAHVSVQPEATIGRASLIEDHVSVGVGVELGASAVIAPGVVLAAGSEVGKFAFLGAGAVVLPGIKVGDGAVVGAGAVVNRNVAAHSTVVGVPARPI